jgi:hypothetical protein
MAKVLDGTAAWTVEGTEISLDSCKSPALRWHKSASRCDHHTFGSCEMDDVSVGLEHVDLLNCLDRLDIELLERSLQLLVVHSSTLMDLLHLPSRCTLSTIRAVCQLICTLRSTAYQYANDIII